MTYSSMLTGFLGRFSFLVAACDSFFVSVRNEPRILFQKSVIFVWNGRATYLKGFRILGGFFILSNQSSKPMTHRL